MVRLLQTVALVGVLFWILVYWRGGWRVLTDLRDSVTGSGSLLGGALIGLISLLSLVIVLTGGWTIWQGGGGRGSLPVTFLGVVMTVVGIGGTFYCRHYLGRWWTAATAVLPEHQVVDSGPYALVRHPIYTSAVLIYGGLALVFPTWWVALAAGAIVAAYVLKVYDEERFLSENLAGYRDYQQRVPHRLIPWVW